MRFIPTQNTPPVRVGMERGHLPKVDGRPVPIIPSGDSAPRRPEKKDTADVRPQSFICYIVIVFLVSPFSVFAGTLSTNWGEVKIDHLEIGKTYNINELTQVPFNIRNGFEDKITLKIEILKPQEKELKPGYQAIEDVSWVNLEKEEIEIEPFKDQIIDFRLTIPDNRKYLGKKYQFWVWTYTEGRALGVGLKSRILISIR